MIRIEKYIIVSFLHFTSHVIILSQVGCDKLKMNPQNHAYILAPKYILISTYTYMKCR